ncbi:hypothetical protein [Alicyclobacillus sp. ALC3]|uniref:hypothetical protein n=1 Tax=Alicyclobacillus sp. ALC3 TaxID=2796143 RepID=UPI0023784366|nr:hypothetical protein [Alicyclobacillus sp. ALC3]WDL99690.1 hypothetical protein JC200_23915 [Alicyclobacillus sp. ALC3]
MLEVFSPIPMTEGESLAWGISTKHVLHGVIGVGISTPFMAIALPVFPHFGLPRLGVFVIGAVFAVVFAMVPVKGRPLADWLWLSYRFSRRPKVILYDRTYRVRVHRKGGVA